VAERHGWQIIEVFEDRGISGAKSRGERPAMKRLMEGIARRQFDMIAAWSVDRLGRSLIDLIGFLKELRAKRVDLYLHQQNLDTTTPAGEALFGMLGVFAQFERAMIQERVAAGMARAQATGKFGKNRLGKVKRNKGRPPVPEEKRAAVFKARSKGDSIRGFASALKIPKSTVGLIVAEAQ
jgi:DNA invertase Pin-like site-specific DNA recombinase